MSVPPTDTVHGRPNEQLRELVVSGVAWKAVVQIAAQATRLVVAIALARILAPDNYGLAAMVLLFSGFVLIFSDLALGQALVQRERLSQADSSTAFWTSVAAGAAFMLLGIAAAAPVARFFDEPTLRPMLAVLSVSFLIAGIGTTQSALLVRSMRFRSLELRELAAILVGAVVALCVAVAGGGAWAVVFQQLAVLLTSTLLVWRFSEWRPSVMYSTASLGSLAGFTANVFGSGILTQLRPTVMSVLIGRFLGAPALGAYTLALNIILVPFNRVAVPLAQVLFPALSSVQEDRGRIVEYWLRSLRLMAAIAMPSALGLIVLAPDFVEVVLGEEWRAATPVIQLLAAVGLLQALQFLNPVLLQVIDRTNLLLRWAVVSYAASLVALLLGLQWGIVGVAAALAVTAAVVEPGFAWLTARAVGVPFSALARAVSGVTQASCVMVGVLLFARHAALELGIGPGTRLAPLVLIGGAAFIAACAWRAPEVRSELVGLRLHRSRDGQHDATVLPPASSRGKA